MTTLKEYEARAAAWAFSSSTIAGVRLLVIAATGIGVDAATGMPWWAVAIGLVAGGAVSIWMPQIDSAAVAKDFATTATDLTAAIQSHATDVQKASAAAVIATNALQAVAPTIEAQVQQVAGKVDALSPVLTAALTVAGKPGIAAVVGEAGTVLSAIEGRSDSTSPR